MRRALALLVCLSSGCASTPPPKPPPPLTHAVEFVENSEGAEGGWACVKDPRPRAYPAILCMDLELFLRLAQVRGAPRAKGEVEL